MSVALGGRPVRIPVGCGRQHLAGMELSQQTGMEIVVATRGGGRVLERQIQIPNEAPAFGWFTFAHRPCLSDFHAIDGGGVGDSAIASGGDGIGRKVIGTLTVKQAANGGIAAKVHDLLGAAGVFSG